MDLPADPPRSQAPLKPSRRLPFAVAAIPALALTLGLPFANRLEPLVFGLPFLLAWILGWVLATPLFLGATYLLGLRAASSQAREDSPT